jgi:hypothetical protein
MSVLIHIGYRKTGTSWLQRRFFSDPATGYRWLGKRPGSHPVRRFVRDPPLEFDPASVRAALDPMLAEAEADGLQTVLSLERLSGSALSGGHDSVRIADRLHQVFPDGRILAVVREQRSMVVSTYKGYVQQGGAGPLEHFLEGRRSTFRVPGFDPAYLEYDRLISYYRDLFGAEHVLALPFDRFVEEGRGFVERIADFAGRPVPADVLDALPYGHRENVRATSALTLAVVRRLNQLAPPTDLNPAPLLESRAAAGLADRLVRRDPLRRRSAGADERLRRAVDEWASDRFAESNARLSALLDVDLERYGWTVAAA